MPEIPINFLAIVIAVAAAFMFGYVWYSVLFGRLWAVAMGRDPDHKPEGAEMGKSLLLTLIGVFLTAFVLNSNIAAWTPATWGSDIAPLAPATQAIQAAIFTWIGYFVPVRLMSVAWEGKPWRVFAIDLGYHFGVLLIIALILLFV